MPRNRFRSQPALQRSGGRIPTAPLGLGLAAAIAVAAVALFRGLAPSPEQVQAVTPVDEPASFAAEPAPPAELRPAAPQPATLRASPELQAAPPPIVSVKARGPVQASQKAKPPNYPLLQAATPKDQWERQQRDYDRARDVYDARERAEGYRWAQQNKIKVQRYCRAAQQRTAAFMQGCMNYLRPVEAHSPDTPGDAVARDASDQG